MSLHPARILLTVSALALLAGCGSATNGKNAADPGPATSSAGYPTEDVVSGIAADAKLHAALLAADPGAANGLSLGTTYNPGLTGLPHGGRNSAGQNIGADVDLRNAVAKVLGIDWTVQNGTFETIIPGAQNGKYAVRQDDFGVTSAREQIVGFATYLTDGQSLLAPADSTLNAATSIAQLCGLTVGTTAGTTFQTILTKNAGLCASSGKKPYTGLKYDATHVADVKFLSQVSSTEVGFAVAEGSPLAALLSQAVNELIANGDYAKILAKWNIDGSGVTTSEVNPPASL